MGFAGVNCLEDGAARPGCARDHRTPGSRPERPFVESRGAGHAAGDLPAREHRPFRPRAEDTRTFTSLIRRCLDLVVHRALKARLSESDRSGRRYATEELAALGESTSRLEKRATKPTATSTPTSSSLICERLGQTFEGIVSRQVVEFGCFVQLLDVGVDGLLHLDQLSDDEYRMEPHGHAWVGRHSKRRFGPGTKLRVIVTNANPVEGLVDLELG
ncbi:MAG: S1 RNA-binding domain-containing protein [Steroidobacteraceae bacterium]